jgi:hypothetical protein
MQGLESECFVVCNFKVSQEGRKQVEFTWTETVIVPYFNMQARIEKEEIATFT